MRMPKDIISGNYTKPRVFLCHPDKEKICQLDVTEMRGSFKFNSYSEITFEVARTYGDLFTGETKVNPFYDKVEALRLIYVEDFGYFELQGPELVSDGIKESKACTAYSLEYTLSQKYLEDFSINTGEIGSVEVTYAENKYGADAASKHIVPVVLYNPQNTELSLLHLILAKDYAGWTIGHVDESLKTLSRSFEIDRESIYDFFINEVCEKFNCYIDFDAEDMTINVYAESPVVKINDADGIKTTFEIKTGATPFSEVKTVSIDGYKTTQWTYNIVDGRGYIVLDIAPISGAKIEVVGVDSRWDSDVFITFDNLSQEININYDADSIKTVLSVTFGDGYDIREVNLGLPYITDLSYYYTPEWMGQDLYDAYTRYLAKCNDVQAEYSNNAQKMLELNGRIWFEDHRQSLDYSIASVSSETVGIYYVRGGDSKSGYYYTEVSLPESYNANTVYYSLDTANVNETKVDNIYKVLQKYFCSDGTWEDDLDEIADDFIFMDSYDIAYLRSALLSSATITSKENSICRFLEEMFEELGRTPLYEQYYQKYKITQTTQIEKGLSQKSHNQYGNYHATVLMLEAIDNENFERQERILDLESEYKIYQTANNLITDSLTMDVNFTPVQLQRLNAFLREDELQLDDIVITDEDSLADTFKMQQDAMETARIELQKISQPQMQFTMSMANIYALPEFEPIIDQFALGRVVKVGLRSDYIKQSRLLQVDINFEDFSDFSCEFGELTKFRTQSDIHADLLSKAVQAGKSVATNSSYWTKGANQANSIDIRLEEGLLNSIDAIKSIDGTQNAYMDKYGIHLEAVNPNTGKIDDKRVWLVNNQIVFTDDGFKTTKSVLGEFTVDGTTHYGLLAEAVLSGYIAGSTIEGGTIKIGEFIDNGVKKYRFEVDAEGHVTMNAASISGYVTDGTFDELAGKVPHYGDCRSSAGTQIKQISCDSFEPKVGDILIVKFDFENTANTPRLRISNGSSATFYPVYAYGALLLSESMYNWGNNTVVTFVLDEATEPDGTPILAWHISDNSSEKVYSKISQTANEIKSEVVKDVNETLKSYSTITQTSDAITAVVKDYVTRGESEELATRVSTIEQTSSTIESTVQTLQSQVAHYGKCETAANVADKVVTCEDFALYKGATIAVKFTYETAAYHPTLNVNNTGAKDIAAYGYYLTETSANNWSAGSIVNFVYNGSYWDIVDSGALSKIKQTADKISLIVTESNGSGSEFEVNSEAIRMAWNASNDYIVFENGEIKMYKSSTHNTSNLFATYNNSGAWYYRGGATLGRIGTNAYQADSNYKGLVFDLEYNTGYMCWAAKDSADADTYEVKLIYHHKNSKDKQGLHFSCPTYANGNLYLTDNYKFMTLTGGISAFDGAMSWGKYDASENVFEKIASIDGWNRAVDLWSNINMHNYAITNQSDVRLKTNISETQVSAIDIINQIQLKEFDWIEDNTHENIGMIAQQLQTVMPDLVCEDPLDGTLTIKTTKFIPYLIKAIQEITEYIVGDASVMVLNENWSDPYTTDEKIKFVETLKRIKSDSQNIIVKEPITLPIDTQGETTNE